MELKEQLELLKLRGNASLIGLGLRLVCDSAFRQEILCLSRVRLCANERVYKDRMFKWVAKERYCNKLEELSDFVNYDISGTPERKHSSNM